MWVPAGLGIGSEGRARWGGIGGEEWARRLRVGAGPRGQGGGFREAALVAEGELVGRKCIDVG